MVTEPRRAVRRLEDDGWVLDAGQVHRGQGTRNRRLVWNEHFFELLWVTDMAQARANPLRLDRRADCSATGASPFGLAFRGRIDAAHQDEFWLYDALGPNIWVHTDNERWPERPLVIVLQTAPDEMQRRRQQVRMTDAGTQRTIPTASPVHAPGFPLRQKGSR